MGATTIAILNFLLALLVLTFLYFKRHWPPIPILMILTLLPLISIFRPGVYQSGDMQIHATKTIEFTSSLLEGHLVPRWAGNLNATYGYPLWEFTYSTPYYISSFFHLLGFSAVFSVKIFLVISYLLAGIGMYLAAKRHLPDYAALTAAVFYQFAPYHLINLHYRVAAGELAALMILPWCFYFINRRKLLRAGFSIACLILSHPALSLLSLPLLFLYSFPYLLPFIFGLGLSSFYWLPVLFESQYTLRAIIPFTIAFPPLTRLFFSPWQYGLLFQGPSGQLSYTLGYLHWHLLLPAIFLARRNSHLRNLLGIFAFYLLLATPLSKPIWDTLPFLQNIQFSYRILGILILISSYLSGVVVSRLPKTSPLIFILISLVVITSSANWANRKMLPYINDQFIQKNLPYLTATPGMAEGHEATPKWVNPQNPWQLNPPIQHLEILSGQSYITPTIRTSTHHSYTIVVTSPTVFLENTFYFPGWQLLANNSSLLFTYPDGIITFILPPGTYKLDLVFSNTPVRSLASAISLTSLVFLLLFILHQYKTPVFKNPPFPLQ